MKTFLEKLDTWTDVDFVEYELGVRLGIFPENSFVENKHIFWTNNPLGEALHNCLNELVDADVLERRASLSSDGDGELYYKRKEKNDD